MHQICDWAKYHEFMLYVVTFDPMKIPKLSAPQNDCPEPYFCEKKIRIIDYILIGFKVMT